MKSVHMGAPQLPTTFLCPSLQLYQEARECLTLLSQRLGSQKFFFGDA